MYCPISKQLTLHHVKFMDSLCQLRVEQNQDNFNIDTANGIINKYVHDMRYKPRINIPFIAEIESVNPETIINLIKEWIYIPESPMFQIKFTNCNTEWLNKFHNLCEAEHVKHVFYEFPSKSNPYAHIKLKVHEDTNTCTIIPVRDVPARNPIQPYVCFARYFRDF